MTLLDSQVDFRIAAVLRAIESDLPQNLSGLARLVNLSNSRLSHLFKHQTGLVLNLYLAERRLKKAADLLRSTNMRVKEITYSAGYCQQPSFVRAFKNKFDCSPTVYRQQQRENAAAANVERPKAAGSARS